MAVVAAVSMPEQVHLALLSSRVVPDRGEADGVTLTAGSYLPAHDRLGLNLDVMCP